MKICKLYLLTSRYYFAPTKHFISKFSFAANRQDSYAYERSSVQIQLKLRNKQVVHECGENSLSHLSLAVSGDLFHTLC